MWFVPHDVYGLADLMGGKKANAAYWFYGKDKGEWVSSKYYMEELPEWVDNFNNSGIVSTYIREWNTLYDINSYKESRSDDNNFEKSFKGDPSVTFPYDLNMLKDLNDGYDMLKETPFGNSLTTDFAIEAISNEKLGKDQFTDVLTISYSSTDYIGHNFGVDAKETQDAYLRLDLEIERLLYFLDSYVGENEYTLFLTADHGASKIPAYLNSIGIKSQNIEQGTVKNILKDVLFKSYGSNQLISKVMNSQIYLNNEIINSLNISFNSRYLTDIASQIENETIRIFPNPTQGLTQISIQLQKTTDVSISVVDAMGNLVSNRTYNNMNGNNVYPVDATDLVSGVYYIRISTGDRFATKKIIVAK